MDTLEHLTRHLKTADDLHSLVRTMKALSAASIRQYERAVASLARYTRAVELGLHVVLRDMPAGARTQPAPAEGAIVVAFGSDHGLCGRFNEDLVVYLQHRLAAAPVPGRPPRILAVGERLADLLDGAGLTPERTLLVPGSAASITATVDTLLETLDAWNAGSVPTRVFHHRHQPAGPATVWSEPLLPIDFEAFRRLEEAPWPSHALPGFTLPRDRLFAALLRQHLFGRLFRACAESQAAEHDSRLRAMQSAERWLESQPHEPAGAAAPSAGADAHGG